MRDEVGVLIRLTYVVSNPFLRRMLSFSDSRPALLLQQSEQYIGPTSFRASWAFLVENTWPGSMKIELALQTPVNRNLFKVISL